MTSSRDEFPARQRLFHAMVLMGGSLALRCGGETASSSTPGNTAGNANGGSITTGGATSAGGSPSTGGATSTGGSAAGGGLSITPPATGGTVSIDPGSFDCPPPQWDCAAAPSQCYGSGYRMPEGCKCDPSRPPDPSACAAGRVLVCREARYTSSGQQIDPPFGFECSCVAEQLNCGLACDAAFPNSGSCYEREISGLKEILCNCAVIVLR